MPPAVDGIQSNHCRNVACANFGVEPLREVSVGRVKNGAVRIWDGYRIVGHSKVKGRKRLLCLKCGEASSLKSNLAIKEELERLAAYLRPAPAPSCPNPSCRCHGMSLEAHPSFYRTHGHTKSGSPRYRCQGCQRTFAVSGTIRRQRKSHENREVFLALVNKMPIKGISRSRELSPKAVYDKIDFIHAQCMAFVADREREMFRLQVNRLYISSDRQDYVINWSDRKDKRNTQLTAIGSADNKTGYVFGMHLNYDPAPLRDKIEALAIIEGDFDGRDPAYRRYARYWMEPDLDEATRYDPGPRVPPAPTAGLMGLVASTYVENEAILDPEAKERLDRTRRLPVAGVQVHYEYTVHAHFRLLRRLVGNAGKIRFFFDQDDTLRAACVSAFKGEIAAGKADALFVKIDKTLTVDERRKAVDASKTRFEAERIRLEKPDLSDRRIRIMLLEEELKKPPKKRGGRKDPWLVFPENTMVEPGKAVCYLTDRSDYGRLHLAFIYSRASLHAIDRYFMQIRRLLSMLERPIDTPSNMGRSWRGYSPYHPWRVQQLLDIYRVYYNYVAATLPQRRGNKARRKPGEVKRTTPAMRLGLAKGLVRIEDILYYGRQAPAPNDGTEYRPARKYPSGPMQKLPWRKRRRAADISPGASIDVSPSPSAPEIDKPY